jgi:hypothetical protein
MELDELLDREGLDPDELMTWAQRRAEQLLAELSDESDELLRLLEPAAQIDIENVPVRRVAVVDDMLPVSVGPASVHVDESAEAQPAEAHVEAEAEESITAPIAIDVPSVEPVETDAAEVGARGRRRVPSTPQPLSASELSPPPEHPRLADGEPEPMLETFNTGPIELGTAEARAMIAAHSTRELEPEPAAEPETAAEPEPEAAAVEAASNDSDDFEIDELEEIDDEELELLVEVDDSEDDSSEPAPPPPPRPPPSKPAARAAAPTPVEKPDNTVDMDDLIAGLAERD